MFVDISFLIISIVTLVFGAERFVDASSKIAKNSGISDLFVGLTIVALGTSAPEIFVALSSVINSAEAVAIGTIVGSNITNIALIFGVSCFAVNQIKKRFSLESLIPFLLSFILFLFALKDLRFSLIECLGFIAIFFYFLLSTTVHPWYVATPLLLCLFTKYRFPILWSGLVFLSYSAYRAEGYSENMWLVATEYILLLSFAIWEITRSFQTRLSAT